MAQPGRGIPLILVAAVAIGAPLPFGAVGAPARAALAFALALVLALLWRVRRELAVPPGALALLVAATLGCALLFYVPLPPAVVGALSPGLARASREALAFPGADPALRAADAALAAQAGAPPADPGWRRLAIDPDDQLEGTTRLLLALGAFVAGLLVAGSSPAARRGLAAALAASAGLQAAYGLAETLSGNHSIFGWFNPHFRGLVTGTFVCANHFASLASLGLFALVGLLAAGPLREHPDSGGPRSPSAAAPGARTTLLATAAGIITIALLWSSSRAGIAAAGAALLALGALLLASRGIARSGRAVVAAALVVAAVLVAGSLLIRPVEPLVVDIERSESGYAARARLWDLAGDVIRTYPAGAGPGTYDSAHRALRGLDIGFRISHAHCDYLQWWAEAGPAGLLVLAGWIAVVGGGTVVLLRRGRDRAITAALGAGLLALAIQSTVEFSLQLPGMALPAAIAAGALLGPLAGRQGPAAHAPRAAAAWPALLVVLAAGLALAGAATIAAARTPAPGPRAGAPRLATPEQLRAWSRAEVDAVLEDVRRRPGTPPPAARLGAAYLAARRAAAGAPLRAEAQVAAWVAAQAFVAARAPAPPPPGFDALARHYLARAAALDPANRARRLHLARLWTAAGDVAEARRQSRALLEMEPGYAARVYEALGGDALELADLMALTPNTPEAALQLASYLENRRQDRAGAQIVLERAALREPRDARLRADLAAVLVRRGRAAEALAILDRGGDAADRGDRVRQLRARAQALAALQRGDELEAVVARLAALGEDPRLLAPLRARVRAGRGDREGAVRVLQEALAATGAPLGSKQRLGLLLALAREQNAAGQVPEALATYRRARQLDPDNAEVKAFFAGLESP